MLIDRDEEEDEHAGLEEPSQKLMELDDINVSHRIAAKKVTNTSNPHPKKSHNSALSCSRST